MNKFDEAFFQRLASGDWDKKITNNVYRNYQIYKKSLISQVSYIAAAVLIFIIVLFLVVINYPEKNNNLQMQDNYNTADQILFENTDIYSISQIIY